MRYTVQNTQTWPLHYSIVIALHIRRPHSCYKIKTWTNLCGLIELKVNTHVCVCMRGCSFYLSIWTMNDAKPLNDWTMPDSKFGKQKQNNSRELHTPFFKTKTEYVITCEPIQFWHHRRRFDLLNSFYYYWIIYWQRIYNDRRILSRAHATQWWIDDCYLLFIVIELWAHDDDVLLLACVPSYPFMQRIIQRKRRKRIKPDDSHGRLFASQSAA